MKAKDSQSQTASKDHQSQTANKDNQSQTAGKDHQSKIANELGFPKQGSGDAVINQISLLPGLLCISLSEIFHALAAQALSGLSRGIKAAHCRIIAVRTG